MKLLLVTMYFPPGGGGGVQRPLKFATHLPALGIETHVLAPDDPKWLYSDPGLTPPTQAWVHRARYLGPRTHSLAHELHGRQGLDRLTHHPRPRRLGRTVTALKDRSESGHESITGQYRPPGTPWNRQA